VAVYVQVARFKGRSEQLLFTHETARSAFDRLKRDLGGLHVASDAAVTDYWELEKSPAGCCGDRVTFLTATENPGKLDYCTVSYYVIKEVAGGVEHYRLYRELSATKGGLAPDSPPGPVWPDKSLVADGVLEFKVMSDPATPAVGRLPSSITVTLKLEDPGGRSGYLFFTATFRPGAEEN
jgi:hypothetical protein